MRKEKNLGVLKLSEMKFDSEYIVKNFIASNSIKDPFNKYISFDYPFSFDGFIIGICSKGKGRMKVNLKEYFVEENTIFTLFPSSIFESLEQSEDILIEVLAFNDEFITQMPLPKNLALFKEVALCPVLQVKESNIQNILNFHSFIINLFKTRKDSPFLKEQIKGLLYSLIMELATLYADNLVIDKKNNKRYEELSESFVLLLLNKFKEERSATYYANALFVTSKHLSSVLKKVTGKTINTWIDGAVILGAKSLLKSTNDTVLQISEALNFPSASYFGRYFKRMTNMTPLEYRALK